MSGLVGALTRSTGIVAAVLAAAALVSGALFSARETGRRRRPAWWLDLHNGLGGITLVAVAVHIVVSLLSSDFDVRIIDALVPGVAGTDRAALAWGVLGTYGIAGAVLTTWPRRLRRARLWRLIHLSSIAGMALSLLHGYQMGTDAARAVFKIGIVLLAAPAAYAVGVRAFDVVARQGRSSRIGDSQPPPR